MNNAFEWAKPGKHSIYNEERSTKYYLDYLSDSQPCVHKIGKELATNAALPQTWCIMMRKDHL